jgi:DNA adenine methylase
MRYMGGKMRIGKQLAAVINGFAPTVYHEPCCGMFSVGKHVKAEVKTAADINPDLIMLLEAVRDGWDNMPVNVTEEQYGELKSSESSALRGFVGFGCSFFGKFFGGFARDSKMNDFGTIARDNMRKLRPFLQGVDFSCQPYWSYTGDADMIYCDPPYSGTVAFESGTFNHTRFWEWVREQSAIVLVSEYKAPSDFEVIWEKQVRTTMNSGKKGGNGHDRVERLFRRKT